MQQYVTKLGIGRSSESAWVAPDITLRVVLVGDCAIGKSTVLERYVEGRYPEDNRYVSTIGVDFKVKTHEIASDSLDLEREKENKKGFYICKLQLWDTAGQERFRSITRSYYRNTNIHILCFDVSTAGGSGSIHSVERWINELTMFSTEDDGLEIYVLGTKADKNFEYYKNDTCGYSVIKNVDEMLKSKDFRNIVERINSIEKVKFMGVCSAKLDIFLPIISNNEPKFEKIKEFVIKDKKSYALISTDTNGCVLNSENQIFYSFESMFSMISKDYLENFHNAAGKTDKKGTNTIDISDIQKQPRRCCVLL